MRQIRTSDMVCPYCKAVNLCVPHSSYERTMISFSNGKRTESIVTVPRCKCNCGRTHALIPDVLIPFSSYSLRFILTILWKFTIRKCSVQAFCEKYYISVSTIYKWIHMFIRHYSLFAGVLDEISSLSVSALSRIGDTDFFPHIFFRRFGFSFLQQQRITTQSGTSPGFTLF